MIIAYATQAGRTAEDGHGRNSPYTSSFLSHIGEPDEIGTIFRRISSDVYEKTRHEQLPELSLSLIGEFYLRGQGETKVPLATAPGAGPCSSAETHWRSAEAIGTLAAFQDHLARYPTCAFAGLAKAKIAALKVAVAKPTNIKPSAPAPQGDQKAAKANDAKPEAPATPVVITMAECAEKYKAARDAGTLNGEKWNDFRHSHCM